mgnify:CR=1 FL=1
MGASRISVSRRARIILPLAFLCGASPVAAQSDADYFRDKTIKVIIPSAPGGGRVLNTCGRGQTLAQAISRARKKAAPQLAAAVTAAMQQLGMAGGQFDIALQPTDGPQSFGVESAEFLVAGHAGSTPRPLAKVASGGELARFLLATKVVLAAKGSAPTLIFDEIDTGVGGAVADAIGVRLARLAGGLQVLAVTHAKGTYSMFRAILSSAGRQPSAAHVVPVGIPLYKSSAILYTKVMDKITLTPELRMLIKHQISEKRKAHMKKYARNYAIMDQMMANLDRQIEADKVVQSR